MKRIVAAGALASAIALSGCSYLPSQLSDAVDAVAPLIQGAAIGSFEQATAWVEGLAGSVSATELADAVRAIAALVPTLGLPDLVSAEFGERLAQLNTQITAGIGSVADQFAALRGILSDIGAAL